MVALRSRAGRYPARLRPEEARAPRVRRMRSPFAIVLSVPALLAQQPVEPLSFVPGDAVLVARAQCGSRWRDELGATRIGKAMLDPALRDGWNALATTMRANAAPQLVRVVDALPAVLDGYGGEVVTAAWLDWNALPAAARADRPPPFVALLALGADGRTDATALAARIAKLLPDGAREQRVAGVDVPVHTLAGIAVTDPFVRDGCVLMLASNDLDAHAARFLGAERPPLDTTAAFRSALAAGMVQLDGMEPALIALASANLRRSAAAALAKVLPVLGIASLRRAGMTLAADGPWFTQETWLDFGSAERGVFDVAFPVRRGPPAVLSLLPPDCRSFGARHVDVAALWTLALRAWSELGDAVPMTAEALQQEFTNATKLDLAADLVALLGDELLELHDLAALGDVEDDPDDEAAAKVDERFGDTCYVLTLRDGARFGRNFEQLVRSRGLHAGRKTEQYAGTAVHRLKVLGSFAIEYAITDRFLAIGVGGGEGTARNLRGVLDAGAAQQRGERPALPADVAAAVAGMPESWSQLDVGSLRDLADSLTSLAVALEGVLGEADVAVDDVDAGAALLVKLAAPMQRALQAHGVDLAVTATQTTRSRVTMHTRL
jgi:hypothetical protein